MMNNPKSKVELYQDNLKVLEEGADNAELAEDLMKAMLKFNREPWSRPDRRTAGCYHEHADGKTCMADSTGKVAVVSQKK